MFKHYPLSRLLSFRLKPARRSRVIGLILLHLILPMIGCYRIKTYRGNGKLVAEKDNLFWWAPCTLYTLHLGRIDLTRKNKNVFTLVGLPHKGMDLRLEVGLRDPKAIIVDHKPRVRLRVELLEEATRSLRNADTNLDQATWALIGEERNQASIYLRIGFTPKTAARYTLTIKVIEPDPNAGDVDSEAIMMNS